MSLLDVLEYRPKFVPLNYDGCDVNRYKGRSFEEIRAICHRYNIKDYSINEDGSIDVDGMVDLRDNGLTELPLQFGNVTGSFYCSINQLSTLEGSPQKVGRQFYCDYNWLTTLEGSPQSVGWDFYCDYNKLTTLQYAPQTVGRRFCCSNNPDLSEKEINDYKKRIGKK